MKGFTPQLQMPYYIFINEEDNQIVVSIEGIKGKLEFPMNKLNVGENEEDIKKIYMDPINDFIKF
jgi:hypothetical protein